MIVISLLLSCQSDQSTKEELLGEGDTGTSTGENQSQEQILQENLLEDGLEHLQKLSEIATEYENRAAGTDGYDDTVLYIIEEGQKYGYDVEVQDFTFSLYNISQSPTIQTPEAESFEISAFWYSPAGQGEGVVSAVDVQIPPGEEANSSTSGCEESDFEEFTPGDIALIQRGSCTFTQKAQLAEQFGAVAVIIFNEGQTGRRGVVEGYLEPNVVTVPVFGMSYDDGEAIVNQEDFILSYELQSEITDIPSQNVFFQPPSVDESYIMLGGHADSVTAGGGINDNGSGISAILSIAKENQNKDLPIRYAFWGGEELGLLGSYHFISTSEFEDLDKISSYINLDMIASPNFARMIYDGDGSMGTPSGPQHSDKIEELFEEHFDAQELEHQPTPFDGRSDYGPFIEVGIASGGLFTGAESIKTASEESSYGGDAGVAYDECYHEFCDDIYNIHEGVFGEMILATYSVLNKLVETQGTQNYTLLRQPLRLSIPQSKCNEKSDLFDQERRRTLSVQ